LPLTHPLLLLLIHETHGLNQQGLCFLSFGHSEEVFVELFEVLGDVALDMVGVCRRHIYPQVQNAVLASLVSFLICDFVFESFR
jgi:hypothetical protein